ncbi:MAG: alpha/beta hydrolase [Maricaulaceae bacterium]
MPKDGEARRLADDVAYGPHARHRLDLYGPDNADVEPPLVVFFYGGGWDSGRKSQYTFVGRALAAAGFVVAVPDYRLTPEGRYPVFLEDCARATAWLQTHSADYGASTGPMGVAGHSAGAYNAVMTALASERLRAAGGAPDRIAAVAGLAGPYDFLPLDVEETRQAFGHVEALEQTQPVVRAGHARSDGPDYWLAHGLDDDVVKVANTKALSATLRGAGVTVEDHYYPDVSHAGVLVGLARPFRDDPPVYRDLTAFLRRRLTSSPA